MKQHVPHNQYSNQRFYSSRKDLVANIWGLVCQLEWVCDCLASLSDYSS